ncbi:MAG: hypothetical protein SVU32_03940, partial [Candidatus Nanohaloarchaea archaeon]|nr:hypothetical protein [Candidatus Nanohaloarchaea archaeon]
MREDMVNYIYEGVDDAGIKGLDETIQRSDLEDISSQQIREQVDEIAQEIADNPNQYGIDEDLARLFTDEGGVVGGKYIADNFENLAQGYQRALNNGIDAKTYFMGVEGMRREGEELTRITKSTEFDFATQYDDTIRRLEAGKKVWSKEYSEAMFSRARTFVCGTSVRVASNALVDSLQSANLLEGQRAKQAALLSKCAAYQNKEFCKGSTVQGSKSFATCAMGMVAATELMQAWNEKLITRTRGINTISIKKRGLYRAHHYDLHPIANWYYAEIHPIDSGAILDEDAITPNRRLYAVSPCRMAPGNSGTPHIDVKHTVTTCYRQQGGVGMKISRDDAWNPVGVLSSKPNLGVNEIPASLYGKVSGSYFYSTAEEGNDCAAGWIPVIGGVVCGLYKSVVKLINGIFDDESDIVYTKHPFVWTRPFMNPDLSDQWSDNNRVQYWEDAKGGDWQMMATNESLDDKWLYNKTPPGFSGYTYNSKADDG